MIHPEGLLEPVRGERDPRNNLHPRIADNRMQRRQPRPRNRVRKPPHTVQRPQIQRQPHRLLPEPMRRRRNRFRIPPGDHHMPPRIENRRGSPVTEAPGATGDQDSLLVGHQIS